MMIKKLVLCTLLYLLFFGNSWANKSYMIATQDTVRKVVEVIQYEYYEPEPIHLNIGLGINYGNTLFHSKLYKKNRYQVGIPLAIQLSKGNFIFESGIHFQSLKFKNNYTETVEIKEPFTVKETVVVDIIYREINGVLEPFTITKEVEKIEYNTKFEDRSFNKEYDYSSYTIPLLAGYKLHWKGFSSQIGAGVLFNLYASNAQKHLKEDFPDENKSFFSGQINLGLNYHFTEKITLSCLISSSKKLNEKVHDYRSNQASFKIFYRLF